LELAQARYFSMGTGQSKILLLGNWQKQDTSPLELAKARYFSLRTGKSKILLLGNWQKQDTSPWELAKARYFSLGTGKSKNLLLVTQSSVCFTCYVPFSFTTDYRQQYHKFGRKD
jgi:hypothetical protein